MVKFLIKRLRLNCLTVENYIIAKLEKTFSPESQYFFLSFFKSSFYFEIKFAETLQMDAIIISSPNADRFY